MLNVKMKTHFYFFTEWKNDLLAAFSMHPTTSTTRTCRGEGVVRESVGKKDKGKLLDKHKHGRALCVIVSVCVCVCVCV